MEELKSNRVEKRKIMEHKEVKKRTKRKERKEKKKILDQGGSGRRL